MSEQGVIKFAGARQRDFTVMVNGRTYYVQPGKPLAVEAEDAKALLERDPHLWERVEETPRPQPLPERNSEGQLHPARRKDKSEG